MKKLIKSKFCKKELKEIENLQKEIKNLKKENKKLKIQNSFKNDIISAIAHEFKNPISIINGYIETILNNNLPTNLQEKFLQKILNNTNRLNSLIDRLYFTTKIENNTLKINKTYFYFDEIIKEVISSFDENRIKTNLNHIKIYGDKNLLQIVVSNLINNALKYSKKEIFINLNDNYFEVIDKGVGIDNKHLELIKEKFYRIAKNDWDNSLGLGLYIVEKILQFHNTHLAIESKKLKGSRFYFDITSLKAPQHMESQAQEKREIKAQ